MAPRIAALERFLCPPSQAAAATVQAAAGANGHAHSHGHTTHRHHPHAAAALVAAAAAAARRRNLPRKPPPVGFGPRDDARSFFWGTLGFGGLAYVAGAAPWALHLVFLAFFFLALPLRAAAFWRARWQFFLLDYCYAAACAAAAFLLFFPDDPRVEAAAYGLTEGPLAAALAAWQCRYQFGSLEHTVSTWLHLLPGLAVVAHRYAAPPGVRGWRAIGGHLAATGREAWAVAAAGAGAGGDGGAGGGGAAAAAAFAGAAAAASAPRRSWSPWTGTVVVACGGSSSQQPADDEPPSFRLFRPPDGPLPAASPLAARPVLLWSVAAPLAFYCAWQLAYFLVVQVVFRAVILRGRYDTSYGCLARRAQKSDNVWNRVVRRGSPLRRCAAYGALQLGFTVASVCCLALPAYLLGPRAGALAQLVKVAVPLWYGARWQCEFGAPKRAFEAGVRFQQQREVAGGGGGVEGGAGAGPGPVAAATGAAAVLERMSEGVLMAAGLGSGDARDAIAGASGSDVDEDEDGATSGAAGRAAAAAATMGGWPSRRAAAATCEPVPEDGEASPRAWPAGRSLRRRGKPA